ALPISGRPTVLCWRKRRWRCPEPDCDTKTWSERTPEIRPRAVLTERARIRLAEMVNVGGDSIAAAAATFGVGWHCANQAVADFTDPHIDDDDRLEGVEAIGVDEKRFLNATPTSRTVYTTQIVDLDRHLVLDVVEGRSRDVLDRWLRQRGTEWCDRIRLATLDPAAGYRNALTEHLPRATLVVDHFHGAPRGARTPRRPGCLPLVITVAERSWGPSWRRTCAVWDEAPRQRTARSAPSDGCGGLARGEGIGIRLGCEVP